MKTVTMLLAAVLLAGCANPRAVLRNDKGEERYCEATGYGVIGATMANNRYTDCMNAAGRDGFKKVP